MKLASIAVLAILNLAPSSQASTKNLSALRRPSNSDGGVAELLTEGGCNPGCDDGYFCVVPDGDCLLHGAVGECYEIRTARTRSLRTDAMGKLTQTEALQLEKE
eukprot:CCRYP_002637-RA/>CCRYP_002637-RA protein AED:0.18 eAED:0.38 QI:0/0/0.5/1/0/0.5/2/750/103